MIIASIFHFFFDFSLIEYGIVVLCSFIMDFDVFFSKYARNNNHRMLITHSVIPGIVLIIIGFLVPWIALIIGGLAYIIHSTIDTFDWGTNFLGFHKEPFGVKLLISKEELANLEAILSNYKIRKSFFDLRYYSKKGIVALEVLLFVSMVIIVLFFALEYFVLMFVYIPFLVFHITGYLHLKKIENQ